MEIFNWTPNPWALPLVLGLLLALGAAWVGAIRLAHWNRERRAPPRPPAQEALRRVAQQQAVESLRPIAASLRIVQDERHPGTAPMHPIDATVFGLDGEGVTFRARCDLTPGVHIQAELDLGEGARHCRWWFEVAATPSARPTSSDFMHPMYPMSADRSRPDAFAKKAKREGYPARSVYKLEEIDRKDRILAPGLRVLELGAAPGSWSRYVLSRIGPRGRLVAIVEADPANNEWKPKKVLITA